MWLLPDSWGAARVKQKIRARGFLQTGGGGGGGTAGARPLGRQGPGAFFFFCPKKTELLPWTQGSLNPGGKPSGIIIFKVKTGKR